MDNSIILATIRKRHNLKDDVQIGLKQFNSEIKSVGKGRHFSANITSDRLDRDNEVLLPQGMDATEFMRTKTIFWNHDYSTPIGAAKTLSKSLNGWSSDAFIADRPEDYQGDFFPDYVWALLSQDIIKGISVGFIPIETRFPTKKDIETYGSDIRAVHAKWKLLEWSIAPLQSNIDGVVTMVQKGIVKPEIAKRLFPNAAIHIKPKVFAEYIQYVEPKYVIEIANLLKTEMKKARGEFYED